MLNHLLTDFASGQPQFVNIDIDLRSKTPKDHHLKNSLRQILVLLKRIFFEDKELLLCSMDSLLALTESTLQTHFSFKEVEENQSFLITDKSDPQATPIIKTRNFLLNVREIVGILTNLIMNQIKILIRQRVTYNKEDFNFETYLS